MTRINDQELVQQEYSSERTHSTRAAAFKSFLRGTDAKDVAFDAIAELSPKSVLDLGCGDGGFGQRVADQLGVEVNAVDQSERMVELAAGKGLLAQVADAEDLPFSDDTFDCVVANWMLYHVRDLGAAVREIGRVLVPNGALVAATVSADNLQELWRLIGHEGARGYQFTRENGARILRYCFDEVEMRSVDAAMVFPDRSAVVEYAGATIGRADLANAVPPFSGSFEAVSRQGIFIARCPNA